MERKKSPKRSSTNIRKKMTREQMQLAIIKKKECDAVALKIVEQLLEPQINPEWLLTNLKHINKCHMEDVIEERAISKICGYVLCQKPLTVIIKQQYHISLRDKKVYDVTKRKNFCSSNCFGAANYLLEQLLTSPLWMRKEEEIPTFKIFIETELPNIKQNSSTDENLELTKDNSLTLKCNKNMQDQTNAENFQTNSISSIKKDSSLATSVINLENNKEKSESVSNKEKSEPTSNEEKSENFQTNSISDSKKDSSLATSVINLENNKEKFESVSNKEKSEPTSVVEKSESKRSKEVRKKTLKERKKSVDVNLAAKVEKSFREWMTDESINFLFGDDSIKQKALEKVEYQDRHEKLCEKLNRLQLEDEQEDAAVLSEKPTMKPAPHYEILKEEGQKLDIKVRAFYQGKTVYKEFEKPAEDEEENSNANTFLPLTDVHNPILVRRKIFLERLDQVLPDLLRTLTGNNEIYERFCCNYTSVRCTAVKAFVHTFSLSATNIIFKNAEWTLVGLIIIKMLSLIDPWLTNLLAAKQATTYISMILSSFKLNEYYLNLFVDSFKLKMKNSDYKSLK